MGGAGPGRLTNYFLDHYVAHKLSELTKCGAGELPQSGRPWLGRFVLVAVFVDPGAEVGYRFKFNFLRRIEGATAAYEGGRAALLEYLNTPRSTISPYFRALLDFEVCISQLYQALQLLRSAKGKDFFESGDGSVGERLNLMYNDSHHMESRIRDGHIPAEATAAMWITNVGLESSSSSLTFAELRDWVGAAMQYADELASASQTADGDRKPQHG
jgi:hypothetical protein